MKKRVIVSVEVNVDYYNEQAYRDFLDNLKNRTLGFGSYAKDWSYVQIGIIDVKEKED